MQGGCWTALRTVLWTALWTAKTPTVQSLRLRGCQIHRVYEKGDAYYLKSSNGLTES